MAASVEQPTVADVNEALRIYRRLIIRLPVIVFGGFACAIGLSYLSTYLAPPYGLHYLGWNLPEWGLIALVVLLLADLWFTGRRLGQLLNDPALKAFPIAALFSGLSVIAQRANAIGMEWSGFLGPLRPVKR